MTDSDHAPSARVRWARLRFQIIGPLLAAPADAGELKGRIEQLAATPWKHPTTGESIRFSFKTIERWLYIARAADDPFNGDKAVLTQEGLLVGCDRLRVAGDGTLRPCLATNDGVPGGDFARDGDRRAVVDAVARAWALKPDGDTWKGCTEATAKTVSIRGIGG